jgi:polynucleotide 5'-hydroxyl-kinase GRC3/NOL9
MIGMDDELREARLLEALSAPDARLAVLIGASDSGKTTLAARLAGVLAREAPVAVVDLDMGQSRVGPPTTVGWGRVEGAFPGWDRIRPEGFHFVGSLSPVGNLLPSVVGARRMADAALAACPKVLVDTTGFVFGPTARVFKQYKIDVLSPDVVIGLEREGELAPILSAWSAAVRPRLFRLPVPPEVGRKSLEHRAGHRREMFSAYFAGADVREVRLAEVGLRFTREPDGGEAGIREGRVVSLRDEEGRDLALGVVEEVYPGGRSLLVRTPLPQETPFATLVAGTVRLDPGDYGS